MRTRPLIIGSSNPRSRNPELALAPVDPGSAGWRLFKMTKMRMDDYLTAFDRTNICDGIPRLIYPDLAVLLGYEVAKAIGADQTFWRRQRVYGSDAYVWVVPHPSSLCRHYNSPATRLRLANLLRHVRYEHRRRSAS